eukprot:gb/GECH01010333.1/.p1 GENE.gb/GECH01010333.1/~~gb/GECH01010333.1/.p1  ORF type:complete len:458 (+),score=58.50 gb/GECH01010333.1/:1-1374(+)
MSYNSMRLRKRARRALLSLSTSDINEFESYIRPPKVVQRILLCICRILGHSPNSWLQIKRIISSEAFVSHLFRFDFDNIDVDKILNFLDEPAYTEQNVAKVSRGAKFLVMWLRSVCAWKRYQQGATQTEIGDILEPMPRKNSPKKRRPMNKTANVMKSSSNSIPSPPSNTPQDLVPAINHLKKIPRTSLSEVRAFVTPPKILFKIMQSVLLLRGVDQVETERWDTMRQFLKMRDFVKSLICMDVHSIPYNTIKKVDKITEHQGFNPKSAEKVSIVARAFCIWVNAVIHHCKAFWHNSHDLNSVESIDTTQSKEEDVPNESSFEERATHPTKTDNPAREQLEKVNMSEIRTFCKIANPPEGAMLLMEVILILFGELTNSFSKARSLMKRSDFIDKLRETNTSDMLPRTIATLHTITSNPEFDPDSLSCEVNESTGIVCKFVKELVTNVTNGDNTIDNT